MPTATTPQVRFRTLDGVRIRYADSGGLQKWAFVLTSAWPESVYAFAATGPRCPGTLAVDRGSQAYL